MASNVAKCVVQLVWELHHEFSKHQGLHVDAENVENLPVSHVEKSGDLVQGMEDFPLLGSSRPEQSSSHWRSDQQDCAVEQGEAWEVVGDLYKNSYKNNLPVITVKINSQNQRKT